MKLIKGADVVAAINERVSSQIEGLRQMGQRVPKLAIIRVGEKPDDLSYERGACKRMEKVGIDVVAYHYPEEVEKDYFYTEFDRINQDPEVDGVLLMRPLPPHLEEVRLEMRIDPDRDVDGISPLNQAKVMAGKQEGFAPCTPMAVMEMLRYAGVDPAGKRVTIVGRSMVVGKPLSMLLLNRHSTVTMCHTKTADLEDACKQADILVVAAGHARLIGPEHVAAGAVVIDVGINVDEAGKLCGDVDLEALTADGSAAMVTTVPGGVGTVTTSMLAEHVLQARLRKDQISE